MSNINCSAFLYCGEVECVLKYSIDYHDLWVYFMEIRKVKTAIIGGGASGLAAAIVSAERFGKGSTVIIERQVRTGRKLLATGNGRCNITNRNASLEHYHGDKKIIDSVLSRFSPKDCERFFGKMGVLFRDEDEGRVYPYSNQATTVLDAMRLECDRLGAEELCQFTVLEIKRYHGMFHVCSDDLTVETENLIFATGSQASPLLGANDTGYRLLHSLNIESTPLFPALSPISTKEKYKNLKGVRARGRVTLLADGKKIISRDGEIQFTDYGISGICVFEISRYVHEFFMLGKIANIPYKELQISVDVMKDYSFNEVCTYVNKCKKLFSDSKAIEILSGALNKKLSQSLIQSCGLASKPCFALSEQDMKKIAYTVKNFTFTPVICDGYQSAQVSAGGISSDYIDPQTFMSKNIKNLYVCGELLNVDGDCGGYNLHFAFGSGILAAKSIR